MRPVDNCLAPLCPVRQLTSIQMENEIATLCAVVKKTPKLNAIAELLPSSLEAKLALFSLQTMDLKMLSFLNVAFEDVL